MEMAALLVSLAIPYLMVKVQPEGYIAQLVFSISMLINGMAVMLTGLQVSYDLLFRPIMDPAIASCQALCPYEIVAANSPAAAVFMIVMCLGGIGMLYTTIVDKRYQVHH